MGRQREKTPFSDNPFFAAIDYWSWGIDRFEQLLEKPWMSPVKAGYQALERKSELDRARWQADAAWSLGSGIYRLESSPDSKFNASDLRAVAMAERELLFRTVATRAQVNYDVYAEDEEQRFYQVLERMNPGERRTYDLLDQYHSPEVIPFFAARREQYQAELARLNQPSASPMDQLRHRSTDRQLELQSRIRFCDNAISFLSTQELK